MADTLLSLAARQRKPRVAVTAPDGRPVWYPDDAMLTLAEVGAVLGGVTPKTVRTLKGLRISDATPQRPIVLFRWLVEYIESKARAA